MVELGLSQHHEAVILNYMKFARYLRLQNEKQIEHSFEDMESRLFDDTYTKDEVEEMLTDLKKIIKCDMESDLISFSHNNVLMLQQLFKQAEKWYLRLQIDISELQNQELLSVIQQLEAGGPTTKKPEGGQAESKTEDAAETSSIALLRLEIERLKEENERLETALQEVEDRANLYREEKNKLSEKLTTAHAEIGNYKSVLIEKAEASGASSSATEMEAKLRSLETLLSVKDEESANKQEELRVELMSTRERVRQVEAQLQLTEMELERKFSETKAYASMKQILMKKNQQIKRLREAVEKYEPSLAESENVED